MENKPKLSVLSYDAQQEDFNTDLEMNVRFFVRGIKPTDSSKYIDDILRAIQDLDIEKR